MKTNEHTSERRCPFSEQAKNFAPLSASFLSDPFPTLKALRNEEPVFYNEELGYWIITKFQHARDCLQNLDDFAADIVLDPISPLFPSTVEKFMESGFKPGGGALVNDDNPIHDERRKWLAKVFTPQKLRLLEPVVRRFVIQYLERIANRGRADLVHDFVYEVPAMVLFHLLGIPESQLELVKKWAGPTALFSWGRPTEKEQNEMADLLGDYWRYAEGHIARLKQNLGDDVVSEAIRGQIEKGLWSDDDLVRMVLNFTFAGHETTTNSSANAFRVLLENRDAWDAICKDPSKIPKAVDECMRFAPAVISHRRRVINPVNIGGVDIPAGERILIYFASSNRDEEAFGDGDTFNIDREGANRHMTFGFGPHMCFGATLARMELRVILEELTRRLPHIQLAAGQVFTFSPVNTSMRGPDHVMVEWDVSKNPVINDHSQV
jgi:cytochrome P450